MSAKPKSSSKLAKKHLVREATAKLRERILAAPPETRLGSLQDIAAMLDVGIVTVQQAARVLEHEGLLSVRRGPGGGYWGTRPDEAALERALAAYLRVHGVDSYDVHEMLSLLDCEIIPAAARCSDAALRESLRLLLARVEHGDTADKRISLENELRDVLFKMVSQPLIEFLCRATGHLYVHPRAGTLFSGEAGIAAWKDARRRIMQAILARDEALARFEAERYRADVRQRIAADRARQRTEGDQ